VTKLNTCDQCGHYTWVHEGGKCELHYCVCGKQATVPVPTAAKEDTSPELLPSNEALLPSQD
jgi:hypothetical protein